MSFTPCDERELFWNFARAEQDSPRFGPHYANVLSERLLERIRVDRKSELDSKDWRDLERAVRGLREPLVGQLLRFGTSWFTGGLPIEELPRVRLLNYAPFVDLAPTRELSEFVAGLDVGLVPTGEAAFAENYLRMRRSFDPRKLHGLPVLIAEREGGPYTEIEGLTRMAVMTSRFLEGNSIGLRVEILLGMCHRFNEWAWR
jgi:hypothetical protein